MLDDGSHVQGAGSVRFCAATSLLAIAGCGGREPPDVQIKGEISNFGGHYLAYHSEHGKSPSKLDDLNDNLSAFPNLYRQIQSGDFVVVWNAALTDKPSVNEKPVLGYQKAVTTGFGWVLLADGQVARMTATEFEAVPKLKSN